MCIDAFPCGLVVNFLKKQVSTTYENSFYGLTAIFKIIRINQMPMGHGSWGAWELGTTTANAPTALDTTADTTLTTTAVAKSHGKVTGFRNHRGAPFGRPRWFENQSLSCIFGYYHGHHRAVCDLPSPSVWVLLPGCTQDLTRRVRI